MENSVRKIEGNLYLFVGGLKYHYIECVDVETAIQWFKDNINDCGYSLYIMRWDGSKTRYPLYTNRIIKNKKGV